MLVLQVCGVMKMIKILCVCSHTVYVTSLGGCPIQWASKLQTEVALSTTEAEYIAIAQAL